MSGWGCNISLEDAVQTVKDFPKYAEEDICTLKDGEGIKYEFEFTRKGDKILAIVSEERE